jgi:hypothetical protein
MIEADSISVPAPARLAFRPALLVISIGAALIGIAYFFPVHTPSGSSFITMLFNAANQCPAVDAVALANCQYKSYWEGAWLLLPFFLSCCILTCAVTQIYTQKQKWINPTILALISASILISSNLSGLNDQSLLMLALVNADVPNFLLVFGDAALLVGGAILLATVLQPVSDADMSQPAGYPSRPIGAIPGSVGAGLALVAFFFAPWLKFPSGTVAFANGWIVIQHAASSSIFVATLGAFFLPGMLFFVLILGLLALFLKPHPLLTGGYCAVVAISVLGTIQFFIYAFFLTIFGTCVGDCTGPNLKPIITPFVMIFIVAMLVVWVSAFLMAQQAPALRSTSFWTSGSFPIIIGSSLILVSYFLPGQTQPSAWAAAFGALVTQGIPAFLNATFGLWIALVACASGVIAARRGPGRWTTSIALISASVFILAPFQSFLISFFNVVDDATTQSSTGAVALFFTYAGIIIWLAGAMTMLLQRGTAHQHAAVAKAPAGRMDNLLAFGGVLAGSILSLLGFFVPITMLGESYWSFLLNASHSSFALVPISSYVLIISVPLVITASITVLAVIGFFKRSLAIGTVLMSLTLLMVFFLYWLYDLAPFFEAPFSTGTIFTVFFKAGILLESIAAIVWLRLLLMPDAVRQPSEQRVADPVPVP